MISDVQALNAYGSIVASYLELDPVKGRCDLDQLEYIISELKEVYGKVTGNNRPPLVKESSDKILSHHEKNLLLRSIDEMRLRMVSALLGIGLAQVSSEGQPILEIDLTRALVTGKSGAAWGILKRACVILMPATDSSGIPAGFTDDLLNIYNSHPSSGYWVIDCSSVKQLPLMLVAIFIGYQDDLATRNVRIRIVWLAKNAVPEQFLARIVKLFDLQEVGDYYFSRNLSS